MNRAIALVTWFSVAVLVQLMASMRGAQPTDTADQARRGAVEDSALDPVRTPTP
ncbi:MAG: hypothetical protein M3356_05100 [Actinomycetota bacterium]|nr:hypothetical protein [Actinomycetota bacterium]